MGGAIAIKILKQFAIIMYIWLIAKIISSLLNTWVYIPEGIIGLLLLFTLLYFKIIKLEMIEEVSQFFLQTIAFFFIPIGLSIVLFLDLIFSNIIAILLIGILLTFISMALNMKIIDILEQRKLRGEHRE